ncbi:MAG TPA: aminotransferase class I/II-fold pyridoxal phosphate-dependent enzyme [Verrucomicrobiae bacterium]|nr:aminotransferase class I/II-fold pyridoxal phosphate-dependent enzyme [Verrucomicrobiae bacterium]
MIRPAPSIDALPAATPFIGPERLMREQGRGELVRLGANESAFGPSPIAVAAMRAEMDRVAWYGDPDSLELRDALAIKHGCSPENVLVGAGIDDVMGLAVRGWVAPGGLAVASRGTYPTFEYHVRGYGGRVERVDYRDDGTPDYQALIARAHAVKPAIVYLANPDNPSGAFAPRKQIERFYAALPDDTLFVLDEAYADFVEDEELLAPTFDDRLFRMRTFSKAYGMAGARIGYVLTTLQNIGTLQKIRLQYGVNRNAQIGALACLRDDEFKRRVVTETARGRDEYAALARELELAVLPSRTNFVCIDVGDATRATRIVAELLKRGVWIRKPGAPPLDRCIRASVGTAPMRAAFAQALRDVLVEVPA